MATYGGGIFSRGVMKRAWLYRTTVLQLQVFPTATLVGFFQLLLLRHNGRVFNCPNSFCFEIIGCGCNIFDFKNVTLLSQDTIFYDYNSEHLYITFTLFQTPFTLFHEFWKFKRVLNKDKSIIPPSAANKGRSTVNQHQSLAFDHPYLSFNDHCIFPRNLFFSFFW